MYLERKADIRINNLIIDYADYEFSWRYNSEDDDSPAFLELTISNVNENTRNQISKGDPLIFNFGFKGDVGNLLQGYIDQKKIEYPDNVTNTLQLKAVEVADIGWQEVSKSYKPKASSYIIKDIANQVGLQIKQLDLVQDIYHDNGYVAHGKGLVLLKKLANSCGSKLRAEGNLVYIYNEAKQEKNNVTVLKFGQGLLQKPQGINEKDRDYDYHIKSLAFHQLKKDSIIKVEADNLKSYLKILKFELNNWVADYYGKVLEV